MTCLCLPRLQLLIGGLAPVAALNLRLPAVVPSLAATLASPALAPPAAAGFEIHAALRLALPPLALAPLMLERISATALATSQLAAHLGIDLLHADGAARLALSLRSLRVMLPRLLPLLATIKADLPGAMQLALSLSAIAGARANFGIDLLAPGAALALKLALSAGVTLPALAAPALPALDLRLAAYAKLALAATAFGGIARLLPALQLIARIELPTLGLPLPPLAALSLLIGLRDSIRAVLGIDVSAPGLSLKLQLALQPLWSLAALTVTAAAGSGFVMPALGLGFKVEAQALAALDFSAVASLNLPNLAPLALLAGIAGASALAAPDCCGAH